YSLGASRSVIREIFEYAKARKAEIGEDKVFDFSIGNPNVPAPECVGETLVSLIQESDPVKLHGYTSAQGDAGVRKKISEFIENTYNKDGDPVSSPDMIYMTSGAAAALTCTLTAILNKGDRVIALAPFFPEYRVFTERTGAELFPVMCDEVTMRPRLDRIEKAVNEKTAAVIINSPNNPTGVVYPKEDIKAISDLLRKKSAEIGRPIYLIADEPYRELVYGGTDVPYIPCYYENTVVCYSLSKSLSLPGERIGYVSVSPRASDAKKLYLSVCGAGRALGFVCATSLYQYMFQYLLGKTSDISVYEKNRDILCKALGEYGYKTAKPDGAFYLFVKSPENDAKAFCEKAKKYELLLVPSDDFGCSGYVRIAYCVSETQIRNSLPAFKALAESYK
ncbi:MAG: pyridoxal phosphate-dependent aminotransferase, partial [Clostridia bacterium]|nr:pyridoxal phosphate-dependent aminotransferase [Clostridia bacterium]